MPEKDSNLEGNINSDGLSLDSLDEKSLEGIDISEILESEDTSTTKSTGVPNTNDLNFEITDQGSNLVDESVFLESGTNLPLQRHVSDENEFGKYLRRFFTSSIVTLLGVLIIGLFYSFREYITSASKPSSELTSNEQEYVDWYKEKYRGIKDMMGTKKYNAPTVGSEDELQIVSEIIGSSNIDYIDKKDLLSEYVSNLVRNTENKATQARNLKQDISKQGFLPDELEILLSEDQAIDTIQRSLNALEVIKFSTATKVYSYMNTALSMISSMMRSSGNIDSLRNLLEKLNSRGEKDISSYVYMCYLNPFEINANCDVIGDLDLYYQLVNDTSIDIKLFKNVMYAISQLLENEDSSLFSITFNGFNAADKSIKFNIEVYTNQEDEKALISQGKKNPNIFILTNIINLLKQSSFIIGSEINPKEINVNTKMLNQGGIERPVNYSTMDFIVPIQKNTEREIFDYIDLNSVQKLLSNRGYKDEIEDLNGNENNTDFNYENNNIESENIEEQQFENEIEDLEMSNQNENIE